MGREMKGLYVQMSFESFWADMVVVESERRKVLNIEAYFDIGRLTGRVVRVGSLDSTLFISACELISLLTTSLQTHSVFIMCKAVIKYLVTFMSLLLYTTMYMSCYELRLFCVTSRFSHWGHHIHHIFLHIERHIIPVVTRAIAHARNSPVRLQTLPLCR